MIIFDNCEANLNGEKQLLDRLPAGLTVFDVGCRYDSLFLEYPGEVHYFDPDPQFIKELRTKHGCLNTKSAFNNFGLSDLNGNMTYYPKFQSFVDRNESMGLDDPMSRVSLDLKRADEYIVSNGIGKVDFLKVDTEGYELRVLKGFGDKLSSVRFIQFEYAGTYRDAGIQLKDVIDYLSKNSFGKFSYISSAGLIPITNYTDNYRYCNIFCSNLSFK